MKYCEYIPSRLVQAFVFFFVFFLPFLGMAQEDHRLKKFLQVLKFSSLHHVFMASYLQPGIAIMSQRHPFP